MSLNKQYFDVVAVDFALNGPVEPGKSPYISVRLKVVDGPSKGLDKYYRGNLHENSVQFTMEALRALGWTCDDISKLEGLGSVVASAVEVDHTYNGKTTRQIKYINAKKPRKMEAKTPPPKDIAAQYKLLARQVKVDLDPSAKAPPREEILAMQPTTTDGTFEPSDPF